MITLRPRIGQILMTYGDYRETAEDAEWLMADIQRVMEATVDVGSVEEALLDTAWADPSQPGETARVERAAREIRSLIWGRP